MVKYDVHPPLYTNLLRFWVYIFGNNDLNIRLFSVFAGILLIPTSYLLIKSLQIAKKHPLLKFVIPLVFAVNPFFVEYSKEARSYSLTALIFSLLFLSYYLSSKYDKFHFKWIVTTVMMAATFLTHYFSFLGIACLFLFDLIYTNYKNISVKKYLLQKTKLYISLGVLFLGLIGAFIPNLLVQYKNAPVLWWIPISDPQRLMTSLYIFLFGAKTNSLGIPPALQLPQFSPETVGFMAVTFLIGGFSYWLAKLKNREKKDLILLSFASILPIIMALVLQIFNQRVFLERYLTPYAVFIVILFFILISKLKKFFKYLVVGSYVLASLFLINNVSYEPQGFLKLSQELEKIQTKNTQVIFTDAISYTIAKYYLAKNPNLTVRLYNPEENFDDWEIVSKKDVMLNYAELKDKQRVFIYTDNRKPDIWFRQQASIGNLYVYSTLPIFNSSIASKN